MLCGHDAHDPACPVCKRAKREPAFAKFARGVPSPGSGRPPTPQPRARPACAHLGQKIAGQTINCIQKCYHVCEAGYGVEGRTRPGMECKSCPHFESLTGEPEAKRVEAKSVAPPPPPRVLFASHDLTLTGAPIILANLIPQLRGMRPVVFSPHEGPLRRRLEASGVPITLSLDLDGISLVVANSLPSAPVIGEAKRRNIPAVWLIHESVPAMCGNLPDVLEVIDYPLVVFPCQATADAYAAYLRQPPLIIPSIVPPVISAPVPHDRFTILTAGIDEERKGQADIRGAVDGLDVDFLAVAGEPDMHRHYSAADLYVCSSRIEAYPLSLQEAKHHALPVITTPVYGCKEIIGDGVDGLHYQPGDVADLRAKIVQIMTNADLRTHLSNHLTHLPTFTESVAAYEKAFHAHLSPPLRVVWHVAGMGPIWKSIASEQLTQLAACGLRDVFCTHVGVGADWLADEAAHHAINLTICDSDPDVKRFERPAIGLIERLARHDDTPILYLHAKGVSREPGSFYQDWRRLMMRELVGRWREHVAARMDLVGVNWWHERPHFSGNFWLASAAWLRRLPPFDSIYRDRFSCERWIGMADSPRVKSLVCTDVKFWEADGMKILRDLTVAPAPRPVL